MSDLLQQLWQDAKESMAKERGIVEKVRYVMEEYPQAARTMIEKADMAYSGYWILPGTGGKPFFMGNPPRWNECLVEDEEYIWMLNRMHHWAAYLAAYALTGEKRYAERIHLELHQWLDNCPCPSIEGTDEEMIKRFQVPVSPWRTLEIGIRMFEEWPRIIECLIQEDMMEEALFAKVVDTLEKHAEILYRVPPMLWPDAAHNHYLMENLGLYYIATFLKKHPKAKMWQEHAEHELERCAYAQLTSDGGQIEGCPHYHNECMYYFGLWALRAKECGNVIPKECMNLIKNAFMYSLFALRPTGVNVPWGDSDADNGAVKGFILASFVFENNQCLKVLEGLVGRERLSNLCALSCFDMNGYKVSDILDREDAFELPPLSTWQRELEQVMFRSDWTKDALSVFAGCRLPVFNGHAHQDPGSFDFTAYGKALIVDPGRFTYCEGENRKYYKSAFHHNMLTIGGKEPYEYISSWIFGPQNNGCIMGDMEGKCFQAAHSIHTCYFPAVCERIIALVDGAFLVVWDRVSHMHTSEQVDIRFHLDTKTAYIGESGEVCTKDDVKVYMRFTDNVKPLLEAGSVSEAIDVCHPSDIVCLRDDSCIGSKKDYVTVIMPFTDKAPVISPVEMCDGGETAVFTVNKKKYTCSWAERADIGKYFNVVTED